MRELNWIFDVSMKFKDIPRSGIILLMFMLKNSNKKSELTISFTKLEEVCKIEKRQLRRQIEQLISYKIISILDHGNRIQSNTYRIHFQKENDANIWHEEFVKVSNYDAP